MSKSIIRAKLVDVPERRIFLAEVSLANGRIADVREIESGGASNGAEAESDEPPFMMPGFVDSHIHIESSMLLPTEFARTAVLHGTVATVSDPHEIANVCGIDGIELMLNNARQTPLKICFGAPSCVPATTFETAGDALDVRDVQTLLERSDIGYLSEVMDFPAVLRRDESIMAMIESSLALGKPVDGHAPGLKGDLARQYVAAGISTDHECVCMEEALDRIAAGCMIAIREGSAARNFDALHSLIDTHPDHCMLCSDDKHPDELLTGHMNHLAARAVAAGSDLMNVLQVACVNPVRHYRLQVGLLQPGDPADFILVRDLEQFEVLETWIDGTQVASEGRCHLPPATTQTINRFHALPIEVGQLSVPATGPRIRVIEAMDGQLVTDSFVADARIDNGLAVADTVSDVLKIVVVNRYAAETTPAVAFIRGFGLRSGAFASSVAHDSHNIVAVGVSDSHLATAINAVIDQKGGLSVASDQGVDALPLEVAGLMSTRPCDQVAADYQRLDQTVKSLGCQLRAPYMTLSFMALLVIPSLKLSDHGLFDGNHFHLTSLFVD